MNPHMLYVRGSHNGQYHKLHGHFSTLSYFPWVEMSLLTFTVHCTNVKLSFSLFHWLSFVVVISSKCSRVRYCCDIMLTWQEKQPTDFPHVKMQLQSYSCGNTVGTFNTSCSNILRLQRQTLNTITTHIYAIWSPCLFLMKYSTICVTCQRLETQIMAAAVTD